MRWLIWLCLLAVCVGTCSARPWTTYRAVMWVDNLPQEAEKQALYFQRLREMGCNAGMVYPGNDAQPYADNEFPFYVENLTRGLFIKGKLGWDEAHQGFSDTRDPKHFIRTPCLNDPAYRQEQRRRIEELVTRYQPLAPFAYCIRDEPSITTSANPFDFDFSPGCLAKFREWLRGQYETLDALNAGWETDFASWEAVRPFTTDEIKAREQQGSENYSPWCDHHTFMDLTFAETVDEFRRAVHEFDPDGRAGLEGLQMGHAFGGHNLWRLSQVQDWMEPYDICNSREIFGAFCPETPMVSTTFKAGRNKLARKLWRLLLEGDRGTIVWHGKDCIDTGEPDLPLTPYARDLGSIFPELTGEVSARLLAAGRRHDSIAIHYSQPSIQVDWMLETRVDGKTWIRRFSSWEASHNELAMARNAVIKCIEDLGLQPTFIASPQIEQGELDKQGLRVLFLIRSLALSEAEAEAIRRWVNAGGIVVADAMCGLFDEHGKRLPGGRLDDLFGVRQGRIVLGSKPQPGALGVPELRNEVEAPGAKWPLTRDAGRGRAIFLHLNLAPYEKLRLHPPGGEELRTWLAEVLRQAQIEAPFEVLDAETGAPAPCVEVQRYAAGNTTHVTLMRNPQIDKRGDLDPGVENADIERPLRVRVALPPGAQATFLREPGDGRVTDGAVEATLDPWSPIIVECRAKG